MVVLIIPMIRFNAHSFTCVYHLINWKLLCIHHALTCLSCTHLFYMPLHEHTGVCGCLDMYVYLFRYRSSMCSYVSVGVVVDVSMCMSHWVVYAFVSSSLFVFDDTCSLVCSIFNKGSRFMGIAHDRDLEDSARAHRAIPNGKPVSWSGLIWIIIFT